MLADLANFSLVTPAGVKILPIYNIYYSRKKLIEGNISKVFKKVIMWSTSDN